MMSGVCKAFGGVMPTGLNEHPTPLCACVAAENKASLVLSIFLQPTAGEVLGMSASATYNDKCRRASVSLSDYDAKLHRRYNVRRH